MAWLVCLSVSVCVCIHVGLDWVSSQKTRRKQCFAKELTCELEKGGLFFFSVPVCDLHLSIYKCPAETLAQIKEVPA